MDKYISGWVAGAMLGGGETGAKLGGWGGWCQVGWMGRYVDRWMGT